MSEDERPYRRALYMALWDNYTPAEKNAFIDAFAHELAEKQRRLAAPAALLRSERMQGFAEGARAAADLIDPEDDA